MCVLLNIALHTNIQVRNFFIHARTYMYVCRHAHTNTVSLFVFNETYQHATFPAKHLHILSYLFSRYWNIIKLAAGFMRQKIFERTNVERVYFEFLYSRNNTQRTTPEDVETLKTKTVWSGSYSAFVRETAVCMYTHIYICAYKYGLLI